MLMNLQKICKTWALTSELMSVWIMDRSGRRSSKSNWMAALHSSWS